MGESNTQNFIHLHTVANEHNAQYTPPTPRPRNFFCVASRRRCEHNSPLAHDDCRRIRSTIIGNRPNRLHGCLTTSILIDVDNFFNNGDIMTARNTALDRANAITTEMHSFTERVNDFKVEKSTEIDQSLNQTSRISPMFGSNFFSTGPRRHVRLSSTATGNATSCEPNANFSRRRSCDSHKQLTQTNNRN